MMQELDIDGSLPRDERGRREALTPPLPQIRRDSESPPGATEAPETDAPTDGAAPRPAATDPQAHLSLIAGAGYTVLGAYFVLVIGFDKNAPLFYAGAVALLMMVAIWFYLHGAKSMEPVVANFLAGMIGVLALIVLFLGWGKVEKQHLVISALLAGISTLCLLKARSET